MDEIGVSAQEPGCFCSRNCEARLGPPLSFEWLKHRSLQQKAIGLVVRVCALPCLVPQCAHETCLDLPVICMQASLALLPGLSAKGSALLLWAFALLDHCPGEEWVDTFFVSSEQALTHAPWVQEASCDGLAAGHSAGAGTGTVGHSAATPSAASSGTGEIDRDRELQGKGTEEEGGLWRTASLNCKGSDVLMFERLAISLARLQLPLPPTWERAFLDAAYANMPHMR